LYNTALKISDDEMLQVIQNLAKACKGGRNYFTLSEAQNWTGEKIRLILEDNEYEGLILHQLKAGK
jgi:hypothetical protein